MEKDDIKKALKQCGVSQADIAARLEVKPPTVNLVLSGRCKSARIQGAIASAIGLPVSTVFPEQ